jgi:hypothetical protein
MTSDRDNTYPESAPGSLVEIYEEGLRLFKGKGRLNRTVARLAKDLEDHNIQYVVVGAVALIAHGYARFTERLDLILKPDGLETFQQELIGSGTCLDSRARESRFDLRLTG